MARSTPLRAGLRSVLLPGWGQVSVGRPAVGWILIDLSLIVATGATAAALRLGTVELLAWVLEPGVLVGLLAVNVALAIGRLVVAAHAWRTGGGRGWAVATLLAVLVAAPHVLVGWVGFLTRDTLSSVFSSPPPPAMASVPEGDTTTTVPSTTTVPPSTTTVPFTTTTAPPTTTTVPSPATTGVPATTTPAPRFGDGRLDLLILGGDAGPGRSGLRTDTMLVGSVDPVSGDAALFGLPRNYGDITFSDGSPFPGRILNEVYAYGRDRPDRFGGPDPGAAAVMDAAEHLTGLDIDYFMLVDLTGFAAVVDAVGGVTIDVPRPVYGPLYDPQTGDYRMIRIETGPQTLDGGQALAYSRARLNTSDYDRMARQRCLLTAMVAGLDPVQFLSGLPDFLEVMQTHLTTDLPIDQVPDLVRVAGHMSAADVRVVGFGPEWSLGRNAGGYHIPDVARIRETVQRTIDDAESAAGMGVLTAGEACA